MIDFSSELHLFYLKHVRLGDERATLRDYRDRNIARLKSGLKELGYKGPIRTPNQGGYAMGSLTQRPETNAEIDHDIDVATIFRRDELPEDPLLARKRVLDGVLEGGGNFRRDPDARTNAVTVWYQENYHVDLAVHREYTDVLGNKIIEHAGAEWTRRDPMDITSWFTEAVNSRSPSSDHGATVAERQMCRIVQLLKYFAKTRPSWKLPGGLIISVLVAECYRPDYHRDDLALYNTMASIQRRLQLTVEVCNPVDFSQKLTYKDEYVNQVKALRDKLTDALGWLSPLFASDCSREDAARACHKVFKHSYWSELADAIEEANTLGQTLSRAAVAGTLHLGRESTRLYPNKPEERSLLSQPHRFYGEDK